MSSQKLQSEAQIKLKNRALFKLDAHVLPPLALLWLANFIDRSNVGNARIAGLEKDTHLVGNQFNTALAVFYASYIVVELPSNWILKKLRPNRWLPLIVFVWGVVTTLSGLVQNFGGLVAVRVMLGFCEGGLLPGIMLYLSTLYKRHELQLRVGVFYASASLSGAFGGLLATAIIKMDGIGGLAGWRWIFILEGIATCIAGLIAAAVLPTALESARFFSEEERHFIVERFRAGERITSSAPLSEDAQKITDTEEKQEDIHEEIVSAKDRDERIVHQEDEKFEWREVLRGVLEIQVWLTAVAYMGIIVALYSFSLFLKVSPYASDTLEAKLNCILVCALLALCHIYNSYPGVVPPYVPAVALTVIVAFVADRYRIRGPLIMLLLPLTIAGYIMAIAAKTNEVRYGAVFLMAIGLYPSSPCILSILPNNTSGHYKKATAVALQLALANLGGFVATFVYTPDQAPQYIRGHSIVLGFVCLAWIFITLNVLYCMWENKARRERRRQGNLEAYQLLWDAGKTRAPLGDRNPMFMMTL